MLDPPRGGEPEGAEGAGVAPGAVTDTPGAVPAAPPDGAGGASAGALGGTVFGTELGDVWAGGAPGVTPAGEAPDEGDGAVEGDGAGAGDGAAAGDTLDGVVPDWPLVDVSPSGGGGGGAAGGGGAWFGALRRPSESRPTVPGLLGAAVVCPASPGSTGAIAELAGAGMFTGGMGTSGAGGGAPVVVGATPGAVGACAISSPAAGTGAGAAAGAAAASAAGAGAASG